MAMIGKSQSKSNDPGEIPESLKRKPNGNAVPSYEDLLAEIERLKAAQNKPLTLKVSEKGALSLYGLGRFPVTLYAAGWERVLEAAEDIKAFIAANESQLSRK